MMLAAKVDGLRLNNLSDQGLSFLLAFNDLSCKCRMFRGRRWYPEGSIIERDFHRSSHDMVRHY